MTEERCNRFFICISRFNFEFKSANWSISIINFFFIFSISIARLFVLVFKLENVLRIEYAKEISFRNWLIDSISLSLVTNFNKRWPFDLYLMSNFWFRLFFFLALLLLLFTSCFSSIKTISTISSKSIVVSFARISILNDLWKIFILLLMNSISSFVFSSTPCSISLKLSRYSVDISFNDHWFINISFCCTGGGVNCCFNLSCETLYACKTFSA